MKLVFKMFVFLFLLTFGLGQLPASAASHEGEQLVKDWQIKWVSGTESSSHHVPAADSGDWIDVNADEHMPVKPEGVTTAWIRLVIPQTGDKPSALFIEKLYALNVKVFLEDNTQLLFESNRNYIYDVNRILIPIDQSFAGKALNIWMETPQHRLGINKTVILGNYQQVLINYTQPNIADILLIGALFFAAAAILVGGFFQNRQNSSIWIYLSIVILSVGSLLLSQFLLASSFNPLGKRIMLVYDLSMVTGLLFLTMFFEKIFGRGKYMLVFYFRRLQMLHAAISIPLTILESFSGGRTTGLYKFMTLDLMSVIIVIELLLLVSLSVSYMIKGNKDAIVFFVGFSLFGITGVGEMSWFYINNYQYDLVWWQWGLLGFMLSLIIILGRTVASTHSQLLVYAKELELFNNELRRSEKMDIISELAASVAHEVRNPLQVTRGFLQLLSAKSFNPPETSYIRLALNELDRASEIITDFLTFAKPEHDDVSFLSLADEFQQVESILQPLASLTGGRIVIMLPPDLQVKGNSSKFKQAIINIVKNSIEAFQEDGLVEVTATMDGQEVVLNIRDNGEGMEKAELVRLGEPYFSNKSKGTGLGLMVTFRIIEAMKGKIEFRSEKKVGTEVIIRLPKASG